MARRKKQEWGPGDVFLVPLLDGGFGVGQVLERLDPMINVVSCVFFDLKLDSHAGPTDLPPRLSTELASAVASVDRHELDDGRWRVLEKRPIELGRQAWPNERYRSREWIGAQIYNAGLLEDFLNAFYCLRAWDDWHDPTFLDALLLSPGKKPANLILKKTVR